MLKCMEIEQALFKRSLFLIFADEDIQGYYAVIVLCDY